MHASTRKSFTCISAFIIITLKVWEVCIWMGRGEDTLAPASAGKAAHGGLADPRPPSYRRIIETTGTRRELNLGGCCQGVSNKKSRGHTTKINKKTRLSRDNRDKSKAFVLDSKHKRVGGLDCPLLRRQERHRLRAAARSRALTCSLGHGLL